MSVATARAGRLREVAGGLTSLAMRWLAPVVIALAVVAPKLAHAAEKPRVRVEPSDTIDADTAARLASAIASQVADVAEVVARGEPRAVVVRLEKSGDELRVTLVAPTGETVGKPRVVGGDDEVAASSAGAIVRAYLVATSEPSPREPAPPIVTPPPPAAAPSARPIDAPVRRDAMPPHLAPGTLRFGAFYTGTTLAPTVPWQNGVRLEATLRATRVLYAGISYAFSPGITLSSGAVDVRVTRHSVGALVGLESTGRTIALAVDVGAGLDATLRSSTSNDDRYALTPSTTHPSPVFALRAHGRVRAPEATGLALDIAPTFEAAPGGRSLVVGGGESTVLLAPTDARFRLDVGGTFDGF